MKLTRSNIKLIAVVGLLLAAGATSVVVADDQANASTKGVDLRPDACAEQVTVPITTRLPITTSKITKITRTTKHITTIFDPITSSFPTITTLFGAAGSIGQEFAAAMNNEEASSTCAG